MLRRCRGGRLEARLPRAGAVGYATNGDDSLTAAFAVAGDANLDGVVDIRDGLATGLFDAGPYVIVSAALDAEI